VVFSTRTLERLARTLKSCAGNIISEGVKGKRGTDPLQARSINHLGRIGICSPTHLVVGNKGDSLAEPQVSLSSRSRRALCSYPALKPLVKLMRAL
jgi:hypothetical protein